MNTRVAVPLSQEAYDAVSFLAEIGGTSRGRFLADLLEAAVPGLLLAQAKYKEAMAVEGEQRAAILAQMANTEDRLLAVLGEVVPASPDTLSDDGSEHERAAPQGVARSRSEPGAVR